MQPRFILFGLHELNGIGWKTIQLIFQSTNADGCFEMGLKKLLNADVNTLSKTFNLPRNKAKLISENLNLNFIQCRLELYKNTNISFLTILDENYPALLKEIPNPPWVIYYKGNPELLDNTKLAIVGTRAPTTYGRIVTKKLADQLSNIGFCIVSGLAKGIDSISHKAAIEQSGSTIAVLGSGIDVVYPSENKTLYNEITMKGLVVSEFPIGTQPHPGLFPQRNRIIAGLSLGTLVIEAAEKSGSLITADQALDMSRDVFAIPGPITSPKSQGTLSLIKQGAKMVTALKDIVEEYEHMFKISYNEETFTASKKPLSKDEQKIVQFISLEPVTFDQILHKSHFTFGHLHSVLLSLLMKNEIIQLPGSKFVLKSS
ncbi:DNA-processing protein DprA [Chengkuizengella axinellae]|uniref:DNA-processing protein DprA n=1 Tax=Chengkuizengella axinellae TaxID=3064388 RepID=A0ABT9IVP6_9BACL|nr:DNA-processing protein DprA [Chengkuizengella sp. 2205SS18-9]MDP5273428.1 DNA-processing protein DprA [Chengkuizengella sp. 2205SS18-9]